MSDHQESRLRERSEYLLDRLLRDTIDGDEEKELLALWQSYPQLKEAASAQYHVDRMLHSLADLKNRPLTFSLNRTKRIEIDGLDSSPGFFEEETIFPTPRHQDPSIDWYASPLISEGEALPWPNIPDRVGETKNQTKVVFSRSKNSVAYNLTLALAVLLLMISGVILEFFPQIFFPPEKPSRFIPLARLESAVDVVWDDDTVPFREGCGLERDRLVLRSGLVQLLMENGVRIAAEGPVDLRINTKSKIFCSEGELSISVPPQGKGFEVVTPLANVVDLGTEFFVDIRDESLEVQTIKGKIELNRLKEGKIELTTGNAVRLKEQGNAEHFLLQPNRFLTELFVRKRHEERDDCLMQRWSDDRNRLAVLPGLKLFYDFEDGSDRVLNHAAGQSAGNGNILGARQTKGRWKEKKAYHFRNRNDAIEFELNTSAASATLAVSLCIDALNRHTHVILAGKDSEQGNIIWQFFSDGSIQLAVRTGQNAYLDVYRTRPIFRPLDCGAWHQLAVVVDREKSSVLFYMNGNEVDALPLKSDMPLKIGRTMLGNLYSPNKTQTDSSFDGRIDQLMIFDRALSGEELTILHHF